MGQPWSVAPSAARPTERHTERPTERHLWDSLAVAGTFDARTVLATPRRLLTVTRHLVPRLAEHVSPTKLLTSVTPTLTLTLP